MFFSTPSKAAAWAREQSSRTGLLHQITPTKKWFWFEGNCYERHGFTVFLQGSPIHTSDGIHFFRKTLSRAKRNFKKVLSMA